MFQTTFPWRTLARSTDVAPANETVYAVLPSPLRLKMTWSAAAGAAPLYQLAAVAKLPVIPAGVDELMLAHRFSPATVGMTSDAWVPHSRAAKANSWVVQKMPGS